MCVQIFAYLVHKLFCTWLDILSYGPDFFKNSRVFTLATNSNLFITEVISKSECSF
jgi:hypothetical protein